jgi:hypothetical protein
MSLTLEDSTSSSKSTVARALGGKDEPSKDEPSKVEPFKDEPSKVEPSKDEPAKDEPAKDEPAEGEPANDESARNEPAMSPKVTIDHELYPHLIEFIALLAPLEIRATSRHWRDRIASFTKHWRLEQWREAGDPGWRLDANVHTPLHQWQPWERNHVQKQYRVHPLFERFVKYPLPTRLVPIPAIDPKLTRLVRALDVVANTAYEEHWRHFSDLEVVRFFSCDVDHVGSWPTAVGAPTVVLYGEVNDPGMKFCLPLGAKHIIMNLGEPTLRLDSRIGVSPLGNFSIGSCLLPHMANPLLIPDTVERMTIILRDLDSWRTPLAILRRVWVRWFRWQTLRLSTGVQFDIVGDLSPLLPGDGAPELILESAKDAVRMFPEFLRVCADPNTTDAVYNQWVMESWRLPHVSDTDDRSALAKAVLQSLGDQAQLKPIEERVRIMSNAEFRADIGERIYAFATDPLYVEV